MKDNKTIFVCIFISLFIASFVTIGYGMFIPDICRDLSISISDAGLAGSVAFAFQVILMFPVAFFATRVRPKITMEILFISLCLGCFVHVYAQSFAALIFGKMLFALFANCLGGPMQMIAACWVKNNEIKRFNSAQQIAQTLGQLASAITMGYVMLLLSSWRNLMFIFGVVSLIIVIVWWLIYPDKEFKTEEAPTANSMVAEIKNALKYRTIRLIAVGSAGLTFVWISFLTFYPSYADSLGVLDMRQIGKIMGMVPLGALLGVSAAPSLLDERICSKLSICVYGLVLCGIYLLSLNTNNVYLLYLLFFAAGFGVFAFNPSQMSIPWRIRNIQPSEVAMGISVIVLFANLISAVSDLFVSAIVGAVGLKTALFICAFTPLVWVICMEILLFGKDKEFSV